MTERAALSVLLLAYGGPRSAEEVEPFLRRIMRPAERSPRCSLGRWSATSSSGERSPLDPQHYGATRCFAGVFRREGSGDRRRGSGREHRCPGVRGDASHPAARRGCARASPAVGRRPGGGCHHGLAPVRTGDGRISPRHRAGFGRGPSAELPVRAFGSATPEVVFVRPWHTSPPYLDAVAARAAEALAELQSGPPARGVARDASQEPTVVFSAHSLPLRGAG